MKNLELEAAPTPVPKEKHLTAEGGSSSSEQSSQEGSKQLLEYISILP
jgi:hypothetical protein